MSQLAMKRPVGAAALGATSPIPVREAVRADAAGLATLLGAAFPEMEWTVERVDKDLFDAADVPVTYVVEEGGTIIATSSVRYHERFPESGYVHWVAVDPAQRGRQLSHVVMARTIRRFLADGRASAILETDDVRLPAIASYLNLGFIPHYLDADHEQRWSRVFSTLSTSRRTARDR